MNKQLLLIVDMVNDFLDPKGTLYCGTEARQIIPFIRDLIHDYRSHQWPVVFLQDCHDPDDKEFLRFPPHCVKGTWGAQLIPELRSSDTENIVLKKRYSGFYNTNLENILQAMQPRLVEVVGVCTSICIMDTVGGLANRDFEVIVPIKGVADFDQEMHDFALRRMSKIYGINTR